MIPDGATVPEWTVTSADETRTFTGLAPGKYRLYETVAEDCKFANDLVKDHGYVELTIDENGYLISEDNATVRDEYVLTNKADNTAEVYFKLIKRWIGKAAEQGDMYPHIDVKITQSVQPEDMTEGCQPKEFTETIITEAGKAEQGYETSKYPAQYWSDRTGKYEDYIYSIEETPVPGYTAFKGEYEGAGYDGVSGNRILGNTTGTDREETVRFVNVVTNKPVEISVNKIWKDGKTVTNHPDITFHLLADGKDTGRTIVLPQGQLKGKFTGLRMYDDFDKRDCHKIVYTVTEDPVPGYKKSEGVKNSDGSWTFINDSIKTKIRKYDANDTSANPTELEGAEFTINKVGGGWSATLKSGQTLEYAIGSAGSGGIVPGDYEMRETKAPYGYARSSVVAHFTVAEDGTVTQTDKWLKSNWNTTNGICFEDKPLYGAYRIIKVDGDSEKPLEGAEFKLYSDKPMKGSSRIISNYIAGDDVVYEAGVYRSDSDGRIEIDDLEWGTYYLEEITAPAGYKIPEDNVFVFTVDGTHNTPDSSDYLELHYVANYEDRRDSSSNSSSTTSTSSTSSTSSSTTTSSSSSSSTSSSTTSSSSSSRYLSGVLGSRKGGFISDVLGARKAPTSGVLGERFSPVTGDDMTLNFWIMVLCAAGLIGMSFVYSDDDDDENEEGGKKKSRKFRFRRAKAKK